MFGLEDTFCLEDTFYLAAGHWTANKETLKVSTMSDNSLSAESSIFIIELKYRMCTSIGIEGDMTICFLEQIETLLQFGVMLSL